SSGHRSAPDLARMIGGAGRECPDQFQRPLEWFVEVGNWLRNIAFRHRGVLRRGNLAPGLPLVRRTMQLHPEVAMIECSEEISTSGIVHDQCHVVPHECRPADRPLRCAAVYGEQTLPRRYITSIAH